MPHHNLHQRTTSILPREDHRYLNSLPVLAYVRSTVERPNLWNPTFVLLRDSEFHRCQRTLYISCMTSALQQAVTGIQLNDYLTRMLTDLGLSLHRSY